MKNIIILDSRTYSRQNVKELLESEEICVHEAANSNQLISKLNELKDTAHLIIVEINLYKEDGIEIMKKLQSKHVDVPFMVLTIVNKREAFIRSVKAGAIDYFLKPYEERSFKNRVYSHLIKKAEIQSVEQPVEIQSSAGYKEYLQNEIEKAKQGNYSVSVVMSIFFRPQKDITIDLEKEKIDFTARIYDQLKGHVTGAGIFTRYKFQSFIGVYPFSDEVEIEKVNEELLQKFSELKVKETWMEEYYFINSHSTYPSEGKDVEELLKKVEEKMKKQLDKEREKTNR